MPPKQKGRGLKAGRRSGGRPVRRLGRPSVPVGFPSDAPFEGVVDRLGAQGDGIIEGPDGPVFAALTLPGEMVRGTLIAPDRLGPVEIESPHTDRVDPDCPHFGTCGGCALQHMALPGLAAWKQETVSAALAKRGLEAVAVAPVQATPTASRRRVTFRYDRVNDTAGAKKVRIGYSAGRSHAFVPVDACPVLTPALQKALPALEVIATRAYEVAGPGRVHVLASDTGLDLDLRPDRPVDRPVDRSTMAADRLDALAQSAADGRAVRFSIDGDPVLTWSRPVVSLSGVGVTPAPGGFLQPSREGQERLSRLVCEGLAGLGKGSVVDLFAGCGTFTFALADRFAVHAVEEDRQALAALEDGARRHEPGPGRGPGPGRVALKPVSTERRDLLRDPLAPRELNRFAAAVIDPPRAGARAQAEALGASDLERIVSVSCHPPSFARDLRLLVDGGFRIAAVHPVDQFPWSAHIECVGFLERA